MLWNGILFIDNIYTDELSDGPFQSFLLQGLAQKVQGLQIISVLGMQPVGRNDDYLRRILSILAYFKRIASTEFRIEKDNIGFLIRYYQGSFPPAGRFCYGLYSGDKG
ncbi:hypothetical protein GCM10022216_27690 [Sphingobacterium kyonggiense]|uniref:Uncharacterized protein n=1 Tax=Sphingobacterium kyonggiense TaxID=714075 RepID=A0ABP7Z0C2_9SPHI